MGLFFGLGLAGLIAMSIVAFGLGRQSAGDHTPAFTSPSSETVPADMPGENLLTAGTQNQTPYAPSPEELYQALDITTVMHEEFSHGDKPAEFQRYVVLHDTEGDGRPEDIVSYWAGNGRGVAAHFVVGKDGRIAQCVPLDRIAHHVGFGDTGHNEQYDVTDESRDDKVGSATIGSLFADYGMNSYSIGIELVHVGGEGGYPAEQLEALDSLIAYLDAFYAEQGCANAGQIIDHKAWRSGNSDTSAEFAEYLRNYQDHRSHVANA